MTRNKRGRFIDKKRTESGVDAFETGMEILKNETKAIQHIFVGRNNYSAFYSYVQLCREKKRNLNRQENIYRFINLDFD